MQVHILRLAPGDDLRAALEAAFATLANTHGIAAAPVSCDAGGLPGLFCATIWLNWRGVNGVRHADSTE